MLEAARRHLAAMTDRGLTEEVIYRPDGGDPRTIDAIVERPGRETFGTNAPAPRFRVRAVNSATDGIAATEVDTGKDRIDVAERIGGEATSRQITRLSELDDPGFTCVEVH